VIPVPPSVFLDANVLFSRTLRDWICMLALDSEQTAYQVRWSEDVLAEWIYRMRRRHPDLTDHALGSVRRRLEESFPDAMVTGYRPLDVPQPRDINDWHVLAAAASVPVAFLVTDDKRAFPPECVQDLGFEVHTADSFLTLIADRHPALVQLTLENQISYWGRRDPDKSYENLYDGILSALRKAKASAFAERLNSSRPPTANGVLAHEAGGL
jgi:predicted nucleic acid-binding protein